MCRYAVIYSYVECQIFNVMLCVVMLNAVNLNFSFYCYAEHCYSEYRHVEGRIFIAMLGVVMWSVVTPNVIIPSVTIFCVLASDHHPHELGETPYPVTSVNYAHKILSTLATGSGLGIAGSFGGARVGFP